MDFKAGLDVLEISCFCRHSNLECATNSLITTSPRLFFINEMRFCCFVSTVYHLNEPAEYLSTHGWLVLMTDKMQN
jgi:hypothetical protein